MKSTINVSARAGLALAGRITMVVLLVLTASYCSGPEPEQPQELTPDEEYLVATYTKIVEARDLFTVNALKSESLFATLDSTIDTLRIANTIRRLNRDPDRWLQVFQSIEQELRASAGEPD